MKRPILLLTALTLVACEGSTGPQGPAGPPGGGSRTPSYCNGGVTTANAGNNWTITTSCNNVADIPLQGLCLEPGGLPTTAFLSESAPVNWNDTTQLAGWRCKWNWQVGAQTSDFAAQAEVCCATPQ